MNVRVRPTAKLQLVHTHRQRIGAVGIDPNSTLFIRDPTTRANSRYRASSLPALCIDFCKKKKKRKNFHFFFFFFFYLRSFSPLSGCSSFLLDCSFIRTIFVSVCLFEIRSPSSFFVYFPFSPPSIFVCRYNPRLCSSFFALLFFLFVPLALSPFPRLTSGQNRCFEP